MKHHPPPPAITRARALRRNPTQAETALWRLLRTHFPQARFRRQVPIGHAIADFASHRARLVIELDGGQHTEAADAPRTAMLATHGYRVLRFWNNEALQNPEGVATRIAEALRLTLPP